MEGGFAIVYPAREAVNPIGQAVHITLRERREVCTFGEKVQDETISVFIALLSRRAVGVRAIEGGVSLSVSAGVADGGRVGGLDKLTNFEGN